MDLFKRAGIKKPTLSMISSNKQFTDAQKVRVSYANMLKDSLDLFASDLIQLIASQTLNEYMFSVTENTFSEATFTEKTSIA